MKFRLAVLDIDGTLLDPTGRVAPRVRDAVCAVLDSGCLVTLASGRRLWAVRPIVEALGIDVPVILYNGAIVYDLAREQALLTAHLPPELLRQAVGVIWSAGFQPVVYESPLYGERVFTGPLHRDNAATAHYFNRPTVQPVRVQPDLLSLVTNPLLLAAMGDETEVRGLQPMVSGYAIACHTLVERQSFVPDSAWWQLDVTAPACSKGNALLQLCALTGVRPEETLAVGDGINDLELIRLAGFGVAMGNAVPEIRAAAASVVSDNAHGGAAEALERFVLGVAARLEKSDMRDPV
ncbi:MAG TPA: HAD family hydrolase [Chloroflexota bacterium]